MIGWLMMGGGLIVLAAAILTSGDIRDRLAGSGDRRVSRRAQLAAQRKRIAKLEQQIADCPTCTPPEFPTSEQIAIADALTPPDVVIPALADQPGTWIHQPDPAPRDDEELSPIALAVAPPQEYEVSDPAAETQATNVAALRAGLDATRTLPVVQPVTAVIPLQNSPLPKVTWGTKAADTTVVPADASETAHDKVTAALGEAS